VLPRLKGLGAEHWYFAEISAPLSDEELAKLVDLLGAYPEGAAPAGSLLLVTPRLGTISPWSSKATDIAHQCGFDKIVRIERGTALSFDLRGGLDARDREAVLPAIHDRMTESVLDNVDAAHALFHHYQPQPLTTVAIIEQGRDALVVANSELGLALSEDEIDYLVENFTRMGRNPTDVEL
jgi:phosphoribosylformylglycinamidine synthase